MPRGDELARAISGIKTALTPEGRQKFVRQLADAIRAFVQNRPNAIRRFSRRFAGRGFRPGLRSVPFWRLRVRDVTIDCLTHEFHPDFQPDGPFYQIWCEHDRFLIVIDSRSLSEECRASLKATLDELDGISPFNHPNVWPKTLAWDEEAMVESPLPPKDMPARDFSSEEEQFRHVLDALAE